MDQRNVDRLFAWLALQVEATYREEIDMAMDCFIEEEYTREELERYLKTVWAGRTSCFLEEVDSTNEEARRLLQKGAEPEELYDALQKEYGVEREVAVRDADRFLKSLEKAGVLEE